VRECLEALRSRLPEAAGALKVLASDAHLTLEGAVASYRERQRVENTARAVAGVASVHNLVAVDPDAALQQDSRLGASVIAVRGPDRVQ
jgi:diphthamide synthase (EF-2-diphthine--ammonia ligase)